MSILNSIVNDEQEHDDLVAKDNDTDIKNSILNSFDTEGYSPYNISDIQDRDIKLKTVGEVLDKMQEVFSLNTVLIKERNNIDHHQRITEALYNVFKKDTSFLLNRIMMFEILDENIKYVSDKKDLIGDIESSREVNSLLHESTLSKRYMFIINKYVSTSAFRKEIIKNDNSLCERLSKTIEMIISKKMVAGKYMIDYSIIQHVLMDQSNELILNLHNYYSKMCKEKFRNQLIALMFEYWNKQQEKKFKNKKDGQLVIENNKFKVVKEQKPE